MENIGTLSKKGKKTLGKGSTSESLMAAQKDKEACVGRARERADEVANCLGG